MVLILRSKPSYSPSTQSTSSSDASITNPLITEEEVPAKFHSGPVSKTFHLPPRRQRGVRKTNPPRKRKYRNEPIDVSARMTPEALSASAESQNILPAEDGLDAPPSRFAQPSVPEQPDGNLVTQPEPLLNQTPEDGPAATDRKAEALYREYLVHRTGAHKGRDPYGIASFLHIHSTTPLPWPRCILCEEEMPWLIKAVYREDGRDDDIGREV